LPSHKLDGRIHGKFQFSVNGAGLSNTEAISFLQKHSESTGKFSIHLLYYSAGKVGTLIPPIEVCFRDLVPNVTVTEHKQTFLLFFKRTVTKRSDDPINLLTLT
jgi:hypothetical protein